MNKEPLPAAFRRLCVETLCTTLDDGLMPPAAFRRLCVETFTDAFVRSTSNDQPPSGGCVLKHSHNTDLPSLHFQPPSGGCVLKLLLSAWSKNHEAQPPSGGCVLKQHSRHTSNFEGFQPPSGGCVLKHRHMLQQAQKKRPSRLQAAVC